MQEIIVTNVCWRSRRSVLVGIVLAMLWLATNRVEAQTASGEKSAAPAVVRTQPIEASVLAGEKRATIKIIGRSGVDVVYTEPGGAIAKLLKRDIIDEVYFEINLDTVALNEAIAKRQWSSAAAIMLPALQPTFPYLDLPNNNVADMVLEMGDYVLRAAEAIMREAKTPEQEEPARKKYEAAYAIYKEAAKAEWSSAGTLARVKSIKCLLALNKPKTALYYFEQIDPPFPGDAAYGIYWLVKGEIEAGRGDFNAAMDAAAKSLCFENKDIGTFPDALLLSARCYEELQNWHRARDVYYEVARIFPNTDWADAATKRLEWIMQKGLTKEEEKAPIEYVFFKLKEDMNKICNEFLEAKRKGEVDYYARYREAEEFGEKDLDKDEGSLQKEVDLDTPGREQKKENGAKK
ncbi:MAG: tetratricopeptide repeat protein [Kiritimatiellia bacterium]